MHFGGDDSSGKPLSLIRLLVAVFYIAVPLIFGAACSKEEQKEVQTPRVVVPITNPVREIPQVELVSERLNNEPEETPTLVSETVSLGDEERQPDSPSLIETPEEQEVIKEEDGYYKVQKGDSLSKVAGSEDVYGNTLMWPSLFRLNMDRLGGMKVAEAFDLKWSSLFRLNTDSSNGVNVLENFEAEELPEGLKLKFVTEKDAKENLAEVAQKIWVVSVISSQNMKSLVPPAITLMKNGYRVYISEARVKGRDWMRLRVGFFATHEEATEEGQKIMSLLGEDETWVTRIAQSELENYGRY
jgi:cell division septation protein DedD